jgi:ABC-type lipoprotein export system ATPase subunit
MVDLRVKNIHVNYREGNVEKNILADLTMDFPKGALISVTGQSGAGKTTLLSVLSLILPPSAGSITYDGVELTELNPRAREVFRRDHHALVFQTLRLIDVFTIRQHLLHVARHEADPRAVVRSGIEFLELAGIAGKLDSLPKNLSGGEKQRAAVAISLSRKPKIVLADEPTASLDEKNTRFIAETLRSYAEEGAIVVVVTHDPILHAAAHIQQELQKL